MVPLRTLVVGSGRIGGSILRAIASPQFKGKLAGAVLVRPSSLSDASKSVKIRQLESLGVEVVLGDCNDHASTLSDRLRGFHTVISAVGGIGFKEAQLNLLEACKQAGVKRFIPSEFSVDTEAAGDGNAFERLYRDKRPVREAVMASNLDYLFIIPGLLSELMLSPFAGVDVPHLTITAPYTFDSRVAFTSSADIGRITAALLLSDLHRTKVRISGDVVSYARIAEIMEQTTGKKVERKVWSASDIDKTIAAAGSAGSVRAECAKFVGVGKGAWWDLATAWNQQPEHRMKTQTAVDLLQALCSEQYGAYR